VLCFVHRFVLEVVFAVVVPAPVVCVHFRPVDHLQTRYFCSVSHHKRTDVLAASLVKPKHPHFVLYASFCMVCKFGLINLHGLAEMPEFISLIMVLKVNMNKLPNSSIDVINILILQSRNFEFLEVSKCLHGIEAPREIVKDNP
jgi:hypothetical protein